MLNVNHQTSSAFYALQCCFLIILCIFQNASSTEITELSSKLYDYKGVKISLPVLLCLTKYAEYKEVSWYKDNKLIRTGSANVSDHVLALTELLHDPSSQFNHAPELQGYYKCETDYSGPTVVFDYLFRISSINTFIGWFVATRDSLGDSDGKLTIQEKLVIKKDIYETEMEKGLFGFLSDAKIHVTDMDLLESGLQVSFYLYVSFVFDPRRLPTRELVQDHHELSDIFEWLNNEADREDHRAIADWTALRGIDIRNITLRSTLGCHQDETLVPSNPPKIVKWPYAYIGEVVIPVDSCSSKSGLAVTRLCTGSFNTGVKWGNPSGKCDMPAKELTTQLTELHYRYGKEEKAIYIQNLLKLTNESSLLTVTDLHIVADILTKLSEDEKIKLRDIDGIFSVLDNIAETTTTELEAAKSTIKLTSRLLQVIHNVLRLESVRKDDVLISKKHLLVNSMLTRIAGDVNYVHGMAITSQPGGKTLENGAIEYLTSKQTVPTHESLAFFLLPSDLIMWTEKENVKVNVVFFDQWLLFQNPQNVLYKRNYRVLPTPVMHISISGGPAGYLKEPVQIFVKDTFHKKIENPVCVYYDPRLEDGIGGWSTEGCEYAGLKNGFFQCRCHHFSIVAVILSETPGSTAKTFHLGTVIYVGCGASIIALSMTVLLYLLSKIWRATVDHGILFWMSLSFLCSIILLFISEMDFLWKPGCVLMSMLLHYTILVTVGWFLVQAIMHRLRFAKKTDIEEVPHFLLKSTLFTLGFSSIIIFIAWLSKDYTYYKQPKCWRTVADVSMVALIPIVTVLLITLCVNLCAMYAVTCRFKKDFLIGKSIYNDSVVKFRVANSIYLFYALSWLFGFLALHNKTNELRILFSLSITITSYYLALFFIFHEISFWELCRKWRQPDKPDTDVVTFAEVKKPGDAS